MGSLIKFELKKMLTKRVTQVACAVIVALFAFILASNISTTYALDPDDVGHELRGTEAIAQIKKSADALAGPITDERATEELRRFKEFITPDGEVKDEYRYSDGVPGARAEEYWKFRAANASFVDLLTRPWMDGYQMPVTVAATIDTSNTVDLYGQIKMKASSEFEANQESFTYTESERNFWMNKLKSVPTPIEYGYVEGWEDFLNLAQFLIFALIAVAITCAAVFNGEYSAKTDAVILSTKYGKTRLGKAKVVAAFIGSSVIYWLMALILVGVPLLFYGADGAGLPIQTITLTSTYSLSVAGETFICCLVGYLSMLALLGIVLALSARVRSSMGILAFAAAVVFIPMFIPNLHNNIANHVLFLFPYYSLNPLELFSMVSFAVGPVVIEYPVFCLLLYAVIFIVGALTAIRSFKKHQVA